MRATDNPIMRRRCSPDEPAPRLSEDAAPAELSCRSRSFGETLAWVRPHFGAFGITRVADVTGMDSIGIPVVQCFRPNARHLSVSQGKGVTLEAAAVSAVMESIELCHAEWQPVSQFRCHIGGLGADRIVDVASLPRGPRFSAAFEEPLNWVSAKGLLTGREILVPQGLVFLDSSTLHPDAGIFRGSTNGLASGNTAEEALFHGICEVIERDADARFDALTPAEQAARQIDPATIATAVLQQLLDHYRRAGFHLWLWDVTSPIGIPAYRCVIGEIGQATTHGHYQGSGCHLSPVVAISRALTEAAQARMTVITGSREDLPVEIFEKVPRRRAIPALFRNEARRAFEDGAPLPPAGSGLETLLLALRAAGAPEVAAIDYSCAKFGIPVFHVVIPGLRVVL